MFSNQIHSAKKIKKKEGGKVKSKHVVNDSLQCLWVGYEIFIQVEGFYWGKDIEASINALVFQYFELGAYILIH